MINIKTEQTLKDQAQELAGELGFSLSALVTASLKQFVRTRDIQFTALPRMTPYLEGVLRQTEKDIKDTKNLSSSFDSAKHAIKHLHASL